MRGRNKTESVYDFLKNYIDENKFTRNNRLPSENFLCQKFSISRETVRRALHLLIEEGLVYTVKGSGTYFDRASVLQAGQGRRGDKVRVAFISQGQDINTCSNVVTGIRRALNQESVELKVFMTENKFAVERSCLESCLTGFDGLIVDGVKASILNPNLDVYSRFRENQIPIIFYNNYYMDTQFPKIIIDDRKCADELVKRLVKAGHTHVGGIFFYDNYQGLEK